MIVLNVLYVGAFVSGVFFAWALDNWWRKRKRQKSKRAGRSAYDELGLLKEMEERRLLFDDWTGVGDGEK